MKQLLLLFIFLSTTPTSTILAQTHYSNEVIAFYEDHDLRGDKISFGIGQYAQLPFSWDNSISSIRIPQGLMVTIYEKENFQGKAKTLTNNWSDFYDYFADRISSFKITSSYQTIDFHKDLNFKKDKISFGIGQYAQLPFSWDNSISSIRIPQGLMVTIYEKENFQGKTKTLTNNWSDFYDYFADRISSFKITSSYQTIDFHKDLNFKKDKISFGIGQYPQLPFSWDNSISSIRIPQGIMVTIYEKENFQGKTKTLTNNWSDFYDYFADRISSFKITSSYQTIDFHKDLNFKKDKISFGIGQYPQLPFSWDNSISSIRIPQGIMVTIYEKENFQGKTKTLTNNWSDFYDYFADRISSFKITSTGNGHNPNNTGDLQKYQVTTETAMDKDSATDDIIYIKLIGTKRHSAWVRLENKSINDFVKGNIDTFIFNSLDLGTIKYINMKISKKEDHDKIDDWQFTFISVYDFSNNKTYHVSKKIWLGDSYTSQTEITLEIF